MSSLASKTSIDAGRLLLFVMLAVMSRPEVARADARSDALVSEMEQVFGSHPRDAYTLSKIVAIAAQAPEASELETGLKRSKSFSYVDEHVRYESSVSDFADVVYLADDNYIVFLTLDVGKNKLVEKFSGVQVKKTINDFKVQLGGRR